MHLERHNTESFLRRCQKCRFTSTRHRTAHPHKSPSRWCWTWCLLHSCGEKGQHAWQCLWIKKTPDRARLHMIWFLSQKILSIQVCSNPQCFYCLLLLLIPSYVEGSSCTETSRAGRLLCVPLSGTQPVSQCAAGMQLHLMFWTTKSDCGIHHPKDQRNILVLQIRDFPDL